MFPMTNTFSSKYPPHLPICGEALSGVGLVAKIALLGATRWQIHTTKTSKCHPLCRETDLSLVSRALAGLVEGLKGEPQGTEREVLR